MTDVKEALKPCPFCGGAMMYRDALWPSEGDTDAVIHAEPTDCWLIQCSIDTADEGVSVAKAWNRRALSSPGDAVREALESVRIASVYGEQYLGLVVDGRSFWSVKWPEEGLGVLERWKAKQEAALSSRPAAMGGDGWSSDMSAAPRDRNILLDLWLHDQRTGRRWRVTDCSYGSGWQQRGTWICGKRYWSEAEQDDVYDPLCEDDQSVVPTHWRLVAKEPPDVR